MSQHAHHGSDDRLNELCDRDAVWGPLLSFRPPKNRCISVFRTLAIAATFGGFYGMLLNLALASLCRLAGHALPPAYNVPLLLTLTYFFGFQFTLAPAWNRRARLLARRESFMDAMGRAD